LFLKRSYVLAVKDNQAELHEAIEDCFHTARASDFAGVSVDIDEQVDSGHGRIAVCRCYAVGDLRTLPEPALWAALRSIALVASPRRCRASRPLEITRRPISGRGD
jgi:hypothetical protein